MLNWCYLQHLPWPEGATWARVNKHTPVNHRGTAMLDRKSWYVTPPASIREPGEEAEGLWEWVRKPASPYLRAHLYLCVCMRHSQQPSVYTQLTVETTQQGGRGRQNNRQRQTEWGSKTQITTEQSVQQKVTQSAVTMATAQCSLKEQDRGRKSGDGLAFVCERARVRVCA